MKTLLLTKYEIAAFLIGSPHFSLNFVPFIKPPWVIKCTKPHHPRVFQLLQLPAQCTSTSNTTMVFFLHLVEGDIQVVNDGHQEVLLLPASVPWATMAEVS